MWLLLKLPNTHPSGYAKAPGSLAISGAFDPRNATFEKAVEEVQWAAHRVLARVQTRNDDES